jgi:hypothetical protein
MCSGLDLAFHHAIRYFVKTSKKICVQSKTMCCKHRKPLYANIVCRLARGLSLLDVELNLCMCMCMYMCVRGAYGVDLTLCFWMCSSLTRAMLHRSAGQPTVSRVWSSLTTRCGLCWFRVRALCCAFPSLDSLTHTHIHTCTLSHHSPLSIATILAFYFPPLSSAHCCIFSFAFSPRYEDASLSPSPPLRGCFTHARLPLIRCQGGGRAASALVAEALDGALLCAAQPQCHHGAGVSRRVCLGVLCACALVAVICTLRVGE